MPVGFGQIVKGWADGLEGRHARTSRRAMPGSSSSSSWLQAPQDGGGRESKKMGWSCCALKGRSVYSLQPSNLLKLKGPCLWCALRRGVASRVTSRNVQITTANLAVQILLQPSPPQCLGTEADKEAVRLSNNNLSGGEIGRPGRAVAGGIPVHSCSGLWGV